jgi:hypothetical protein
MSRIATRPPGTVLGGRYWGHVSDPHLLKFLSKQDPVQPNAIDQDL